jgi:predicted LPLAT superfamily acyltransferase
LHFDLFAESVSIDRRTRAADLQATVQRYSQRLEHYVHLAPFNWFNFYDFWQTDRASPAVAAAVGVRRAAVDGAARG